MKIGIFINPVTNRLFARETLFKIADQYLDANRTQILEQKNYIRLSDIDNTVELFILGESLQGARGRRFHKIYFDPRYSIAFIYEALLPSAILPTDNLDCRAELAWL